MTPESTLTVLLLGSGGRESAIAWKLAQSPLLKHLYIAPGNAGTSAYGTNLSIKATDFAAVAEAVKAHNVDLVIAGNEDPLVGGLREALEESVPGVLILGPGAAGAALEGSKDFAKDFMGRHNIPTARHLTVTNENVEQGREFLRSLKAPYVLKADGLAAGKGVIITPTLDEAFATLDEMLAGQFGKASAKVVIEEFLSGIECSVFTITDGTGNYRLLPVAKDYKRAYDADQGPNTGGMGSVSPVPFADDAFMAKVVERIIEPTHEGLRKEGIDYRGFIFYGLINCGGDPYVIEYNVRMGDPETESVMARISSDLLPLAAAAAAGNIGDVELTVDPRTAVAVMAVSNGYPGSYTKGHEITGLENVEGIVFHAGTATVDGRVVTAGGRVLATVSLANDIPTAAAGAYALLEGINFEGKRSRSDIGKDLL